MIDMEVILKKTKITNSILKQTLRASSFDFKTHEVIGWCIYIGSKYIVLYRSSTNELKKYLMFKDVEYHNYDKINHPFDVTVKYGGNYVPSVYDIKIESEAIDFIDTLKTVKHQATIKGQFFI